MLPYYQFLLEHDSKFFTSNDDLIQRMRTVNEDKLKELDEKIKDAEDNFGESEVREANLNKAEYYHKIGDKEKTLTQYRITSEKTVSLGQRLDIVFGLLRVGFAFLDLDLIQRNVEKAKRFVLLVNPYFDELFISDTRMYLV